MFSKLQGGAISARGVLVGLAAVAVVAFRLPSFAALMLGAVFGLGYIEPILDSQKATKIGNKLMKASIIALGAGMNLGIVFRVGLSGFATTAATLAVALLLGFAIGRFLGVGREVAMLVTVGTAICGGSAIAATAPVIRARTPDIGVALGVVFVLNAVALFVFPFLGTWLGLDPETFGRWSALAIHDTSSVVGAAATHGPVALEIATVTKLARALWIIPVVFAAAWIVRRGGKSSDEDGATPTVPLFILGFLGTAMLFSFVPGLESVGAFLSEAGRRVLVLALFFIGLGFSRKTLRTLGLRPLLLGVALWAPLGVISLAVTTWT